MPSRSPSGMYPHSIQIEFKLTANTVAFGARCSKAAGRTRCSSRSLGECSNSVATECKLTPNQQATPRTLWLCRSLVTSSTSRELSLNLIHAECQLTPNRETDDNFDDNTWGTKFLRQFVHTQCAPSSHHVCANSKQNTTPKKDLPQPQPPSSSKVRLNCLGLHSIHTDTPHSASALARRTVPRPVSILGLNVARTEFKLNVHSSLQEAQDGYSPQ